MSESDNRSSAPPAPKLPEVESPPPEDVLDSVPSREEIVEQAESAEKIVEAQPSPEELLGHDRPRP
jgi:hypothetical protein